VRRGIFKNWEIKLACLAIAAALWFYAYQTERSGAGGKAAPSAPQSWYVNSVRITDVPVLLKGKAGDLKLNPDKVTITVKLISQISLEKLSSIRAEVDVKRIGKDVESIELLDSDFVLPSGVQLLFVEPRMLRIVRGRT